MLSGCFASPPQIIGLDPGREQQGVAADASISVQFDRPVQRASFVGRFTIAPPIRGCDIDAALTGRPAGTCRVVWEAGDTEFVVQHPGAILKPSTHYLFTLRGGFSDPQGSVNSLDHGWGMSTAPAPLVRAASPGDGALDVPVDSPIAISFSEPMASTPTLASISLSPSPPETRVVGNARDPGRFVILPGRLMAPTTTYRVDVSGLATNQHGQALAVPWSTTFTTGALSTTPHALVLERSRGEVPSRLVMTALAATQAGDPIPVAALVTAPRCGLPSGCGQAAAGSPLVELATPALAPGGRWLALVERDQTTAARTPTIVVIDPATGTTVATATGGSLPSWSPDGTTLAYAHGAEVRLLNLATGATSALPSGDPLVTAPLWGPNGELLVLDAGGPGAVEHIDLADAVIGARYPFPKLAGPTSAPVISPDGALLAVFRSGEALAGTWLVNVGDPSAPRQLNPDLVPVGYSGARTLIAITRAGGGASGLVRVNVADNVQIAIPHTSGAALLSSVRVTPSGRQLLFLAPDAAGVTQGFVENVDGSDPQQLTTFDIGTDAVAVVAG